MTRRALVTAQEVVAVAARPERIADFYLLRSILRELAPEGVDGRLMDLLAQQRSRYFGDHDWARPVVDAILALNPPVSKTCLYLRSPKRQMPRSVDKA